MWDWTTRRCSFCNELTNQLLCNKRDLSQTETFVTGNLPLLFFENCKGAGSSLLDISYGACKRCDVNNYKNQLECDLKPQYLPAGCQSAGSVFCKECSRTAQVLYIDVLAGRWLDQAWPDSSTSLRRTHCQISACKARKANGLILAHTVKRFFLRLRQCKQVGM